MNIMLEEVEVEPGTDKEAQADKVVVEMEQDLIIMKLIRTPLFTAAEVEVTEEMVHP
jgi:hypothetical protein